MSKAQKKPVVIDYFSVDARTASIEGRLQHWMGAFGDTFSTHFEAPVDGVSGLKVKTLEGTSYDVTTADVIIRGVKGEYYPCKKDIFKETYSPVGELLTPQEQELWDQN